MGGPPGFGGGQFPPSPGPPQDGHDERHLVQVRRDSDGRRVVDGCNAGSIIQGGSWLVPEAFHCPACGETPHVRCCWTVLPYRTDCRYNRLAIGRGRSTDEYIHPRVRLSRCWGNGLLPLSETGRSSVRPAQVTHLALDMLLKWQTRFECAIVFTLGLDASSSSQAWAAASICATSLMSGSCAVSEQAPFLARSGVRAALSLGRKGRLLLMDVCPPSVELLGYL